MDIISYLEYQRGKLKKHSKKWLYSQFLTLSILSFEFATIGDGNISAQQSCYGLRAGQITNS